MLLELGNEVDHYIGESWRAPGWDVAQYIEQFNNLTASIMAADWYTAAAAPPPKFQAASFADPPWVPDQQNELDDFDIINLTARGLVDPAHRVIETYAVHLYPQSTCDTERWLRMRLDLLSNHTALWLNVSQYVPQVAAADAANTSLVFGETNSVSCSGRSGISDTFGAALWSADYVLLAASIGMPQVYFHLGAQSQYSAFTPQSVRCGWDVEMWTFFLLFAPCPPPPHSPPYFSFFPFKRQKNKETKTKNEKKGRKQAPSLSALGVARHESRRHPNRYKL